MLQICILTKYWQQTNLEHNIKFKNYIPDHMTQDTTISSNTQCNNISKKIVKYKYSSYDKNKKKHEKK